MRVLITGGTGYIGDFARRKFIRHGHKVICTTRKLPPKPPKGSATWIELDLNDFSTDVFCDLGHIDCLVHLAFEHVPGKYRGGEGDDPERFWHANVEGTRRLFEAARKARIYRTVFLSSRAVFSDELPEDCELPIPDTQEPFPSTLYGKCKAEVEGLAEEFEDIGLVSLRATGVYGVIRPIEKSKWWDLLTIDSYDRVPESYTNQGKTEVLIDDVVNAVRLLLEINLRKTDLRVFNCSDVVVSDERLWYVAWLCKRGVSDVRGQLQLPPVVLPKALMDSEVLRQLGWQPRNWYGVFGTVREMLYRKGKLDERFRDKWI